MRPVFVASYGAGAASARTRMLHWVQRLGLDAEIHDYLGTSRHGIELLAASSVRYVAAELSLHRLCRQRHSHLFLHREASPFGHGRLESDILRLADRAIYDFDDALMWEPPGGLARRAVMSRRNKVRRAVSQADVVIAGNEVLADWASRRGKDVRVIPTCIEPGDYRHKTSYVLGDPPRLVWLGSPSTEVYLHTIARPLLEVHRRTGARLTVISAGSANLGSLDPIIDRVDWSEADYPALLASADIGVAPLDDTPYARGKCAYKLLQYAAAGLPAVASPPGANAVVANRTGASLALGDEWVDAITALFELSDAARSQVGTNSRAAAGRYYSYASWQAAWLAALGLSEIADLQVPGTRSAWKR